jgi:hypothetical protein
MRFEARIAAAAFTLGALFAAPAAAQSSPTFGRQAILDEFNADVYGGSDSARVAAGLSFGSVARNGFWWSYGARASWVHFAGRGAVVDGWGLGGTLGCGWEPARVVSPVAGLSVEKTFGTGGRIDFQTLVHAGARVRISPDAGEHVAVTFAVFASQQFAGKNDFDRDDVGIAVLFSTARLAAR